MLQRGDADEVGRSAVASGSTSVNTQPTTADQRQANQRQKGTAPMKLDTGDTFPEFALSDLDDEQVTIPALFGDGWGIVLVYRGHW